MMNFLHKLLEILQAIQEQAVASAQAVRNLIEVCKELQEILARDLEAEFEQKLQVITEDVKKARQRLADSLKENK